MSNAEQTIVDIRTLRDDCRNPAHEEGQHQARFGAAALDMTADDAEDLRAFLLHAVTAADAHYGRRDGYG